MLFGTTYVGTTYVCDLALFADLHERGILRTDASLTKPVQRPNQGRGRVSVHDAQVGSGLVDSATQRA